MADQATEHMSVSASPERCFSVVADIERYPEWAADIKEIIVDERDDQGRPAAGHVSRRRLRAEHELHPALRLLRGPARPVVGAHQGRHHLEVGRELRLRPGRRFRDARDVPLGGRAPGAHSGLHQNARPEPHHVDGHAGAEGTGRVFGMSLTPGRRRGPAWRSASTSEARRFSASH